MTRFRAAGRPAGKRAGSAAGSASGGRGSGAVAPSTSTAAAPDAAAHATGDESPTSAAAERPGGPRRGAPWWLVALLAVLAVGGLVLAAVLLSRPSDVELRESAVAAGTRYTEFLTTYDARTLEEDVARMAAVSTEEFAEEYRRTVEELRPRIAEQQATSTGTVVGSGVERLEGDTATVLVAVDQELTSSGQEPRTEANRVRLRLVREDGSWVVADVERL